MTPALLINNLLAFELPADATDVGFRLDQLTCKTTRDKPGAYTMLPDIDDWMRAQGGEWEVVGTVRECTEEVAKGIVEEVRLRGHIRYEDYTREFMWHETAVDSLNSLIASKGLDNNKNWLLVRKG